VESKVKAAPTVERIRARLAAERPARDPRERLRANVDGPVSPALEAVLERPGRAASVLLALLARPAGLAMLLTVRAPHLKDHAGQVSLPGGRIAQGETAAAAALREAHEEVGLTPGAVDVLGSLDVLLTGTGFAVTPVVGLITNAAFVAIPDPREVAHVFEVPLEHLLQRGSITVGYFERHDARLRTYELHHEGFRIWGATAAILHDFREVILDERAT
jgi:8-oxo-dGTP pyrophosphatase MutT (NUDIX family)